jgi:protein TonB
MKAAVVSAPEVYSAREMARAAGRPDREIETLIAGGRVPLVGRDLVAHDDAVRVLRALKAARPLLIAVAPRRLFEATGGTPREARVPLIASTAAHGAVLGGVLLLSLFGRPQVTDALSAERLAPARLVFLATPGPGGGGGGSGEMQPRPPSAARRQGSRSVSSPVPPAEPITASRPQEATPDPPLDAPVASVPADAETREGVIEESQAGPSKGSGEGGRAGPGNGAGLGAGQGSGIDEGSGGGTGGGPYRAGSGIEPPALLRELKPDYSEEARRQSVEGDVLLEIVVRRDGSVGDVRVLQGLGHGLDERAVQAVRQWRFSPAHRRGTAVDVIVEVAVEFKLR